MVFLKLSNRSSGGISDFAGGIFCEVADILKSMLHAEILLNRSEASDGEFVGLFFGSEKCLSGKYRDFLFETAGPVSNAVQYEAANFEGILHAVPCVKIVHQPQANSDDIVFLYELVVMPSGARLSLRLRVRDEHNIPRKKNTGVLALLFQIRVLRMIPDRF